MSALCGFLVYRRDIVGTLRAIMINVGEDHWENN